MEHPVFVLPFIGLCIALVCIFIFRPDLTSTSGGKIMAFLVFFILPVLCLGAGFSSKLESSKSTRFCLSCHIMEPYGKSLLVDDPGHLAAAHFQNHRVPPEDACYTCHTNYAMFGGVKAKLGGLKHIYVYYLKTPPAPEDIKLYDSYHNRECLHCHAGARSFEEGAVHAADPDLLPALRANKTSCVSSGCHDMVHNVRSLKDAKFWKGGS
jgi:Nitrate/TMAO reductases, membrane-bound tetraheme cytochrome c subunit